MSVDISPINSRSKTVRYFEDDSGIAPGGPVQYYAGRDFEHRAASRWFGRGARMLNLRGVVDKEDFRAVLNGRIEERCIELGRRVEAGESGRTRREHRPGDDLTFKAPKSVSIAALKYEEKAAVEAFEKAVWETLRWIEATRVTTRRSQRRETTGNMVAATFTHDTSRNHDPHLHKHVILANMTRRDDGKWMSIDRGSVSNDMPLIAAHFHNELARNLMEAGYRIRHTIHRGVRSFEIEGYTEEMIEAYSTRRRDIRRDLEERGIRYTPRAAQKAALRTRKPKVEIDRAELRRSWDETAERMGFENPCTKADRTRNRKEARRLRAGGIDDPTGRDPEADLFRAIRRSLEHLGYHTPVVGDTALKSAVLGQMAGRVMLERVEAALEQMADEGHLTKTRKPRAPTAWVTREALAAEMGVIRTMAEGQGRVRAIRPGFDAAAEIGDRGLTEGQSAAIGSILTSTDRVSGVQGYAGTGKTTMLRTLVEMAGGRRFIGLAPTVGASVLLGAEADIPSETLQRFLVQHKDLAKGNGTKVDEAKLAALRKEFKDTVVVVDEASMIGTRQMERLFAIVEALDIERLVLVGDKRQLRSIEAGQPFRQLQEQGMETAVMEDIVRQRNDGLKIPVEMMLAGNPTRAIERLGAEGNAHGRLVEVDREYLHESVAGLYLKLNDEQRRGTIVMAQTNADRQEINERIREGLAIEGTLGDHEYNGHRLVNRHMTPVEKADPLNYEPGDVLVFHSRYRSDNGDDHYTVREVGEDGYLHIESASGHRRDFDPGKGNTRYRYEVFEVEDIRLRENDLVRFTRNDPELRGQGVINGAEATVERIGEDAVALRLAGDADDPNAPGDDAVIELAFDHDALRHIDHGYCRTTYSAQGRTSERVIALADTGMEHLADQQNFYVQISRASEEAVVVTDDIEGLSHNLERHTGERLSAMEAVGMTGPENGTDLDRDIVMPGQLPQQVRDMMDRLGGEAAQSATMNRAKEDGPEQSGEPTLAVDGPEDDQAPEVEEPFIGEIGTDIIEVEDGELNDIAAKCWLGLDDEVRDRTRIMASPDRQDDIADIIRGEYSEQGRINGPGVEVNRLVLLPLTDGEKRDGGKFKVGDDLVFSEAIPESGIRAGRGATVVAVERTGDRNRIRIRTVAEDGRLATSTLTPDLAEAADVYRAMPMELRAGDRVRWKVGIEKHGIVAGQQMEITKVEDRGIRIRYGDGGEVVLGRHSSAFKSCDYDFNFSEWDFRKGKVENVIAVTSSTSPDSGVIAAAGRELDRRGKNAMVVTDERAYVNVELEDCGCNPLAKGKNIKGLVHDVYDEVRKAVEKDKEQSRGMGMRF